MNPQEELAALRRMKELEDKAAGVQNTAPAADPAIAKQANYERIKAELEAKNGPSAVNPTEGMSGYGKLVAGMGKPVHDMGRGFQQIYAGVADAVSPRQRSLSDLVTGHDPSRSAEIQKKVLEDRAADAPLMDTGAGQVGNVAGNLAMFAVPMSKVGALPRVGQYMASAGIGAAAGALDPIAGDESRLGNAALGGTLGLAGQATGDVLQATGRMAASKVSKDAKAIYAAAKARGIDLTPTQLSDSRFMGWLRGQLGSLPGSGAPAQAAKQAEQFNTAVSKTVGESAPMSREVFDQALTRLGGQFDKFTRNDIPLTNGFMSKVLKVQDEAAGLADDSTARNMKYIADRIFKQGSNGTLPGKAVQSIDSDLSKIMRQGGERAMYAGKMREALHDQIGRTIGPSEKAAWDETRGQYANAMKIMGLVGKNDGVPAAQLMGAVTNNGAGKRAMARDRGGEMGQLAKIGQRMKGAPSSGTAERLQSAGLGAAFFANPLGTLAGLTGGRVARGLSDSDMLAKALLNRGAARQAIAPYARGAGLGVMRYSPNDDTGDGP